MIRLTSELLDELCKTLETGATHKIAFGSIGLKSATFYRWLKLGEEGDERYITFFQRVRKSEAKGALSHLQTINTASRDDWKASAWVLERRWGYRRQGPTEERQIPVEKVGSLSPLEHLERQLSELREASRRALNTGSFQAFSALKRQELRCMFEMRSLKQEEKEKDQFSELSDHQLLTEIEDLINSLPPVLRQKIYEGK